MSKNRSKTKRSKYLFVHQRIAALECVSVEGCDNDFVGLVLERARGIGLKVAGEGCRWAASVALRIAQEVSTMVDAACAGPASPKTWELDFAGEGRCRRVVSFDGRHFETIQRVCNLTFGSCELAGLDDGVQGVWLEDAP